MTFCWYRLSKIFYCFTADSSEGLVRIFKRENNSRCLLKGFTNAIEDISFAHLYEIIMLACIDQSGNVYVYVIKEDISSQTIKAFPVFQINGVCIQFLISIYSIKTYY